MTASVAPPSFLHVGCGPKRQDRTPFADQNWREIRLDIDKSVVPDVIGTMTNMPEVLESSVDAIFSSHNIEHLYPFEVIIALDEFKRVLNHDGFLLLTCPDLQSVCKLVADDLLCEPAYQSGMGPISPLDILYGHRASLKQGNLYMAHRCGFTKRVLSQTLAASGFSCMVRSRPSHFDLWALGVLNSDKATERLQSLSSCYFP